MTDKTVLLRCNHCKTINRVPVDRLMNNPKCGKCKVLLEVPGKPIDVTTADYDREALAWPGVVLVEFWAPWCGACRVMATVIDELEHERSGLLA